jgi:hypothetical protein
MRPILNFAAVATILFLASCEGNTDYTWRVTNDSSTSITAYTQGIIDTAPSVQQIDSGSTETIYIGGQMGGNPNEQLPETYLNSLIIVNANGDTMQSGYMDPGKWISEIEQVKKTPSHYEHTYTFVVEDSDF